jgi:hypothetical protein
MREGSAHPAKTTHINPREEFQSMKRFFGKRAALTALLVVTLQLTAPLVTRATDFACSTDSYKCSFQASCTGDLYVRNSCSLQCYKNVQNIEQPGQIEPTGSATCGTPVTTGTGGGGTGPVGGGGGYDDGGWGGGLWDPCDPFWYADYDAVACADWFGSV